MNNLNSLQGWKKTLSIKAINAKLNNYEKNGSVTHFFYDSLVFNKIKKIFGGNLGLIISGSAALDKNILLKLKIFFCCAVAEGFG